MRREDEAGDRRRRARARVRGRIVIRGARGGVGEIFDVSTTGVRFRLARSSARFQSDERVEMELRFDGAKGHWWGISGRVVRSDAYAEIVVAFHEIPTDFEDSVQEELVAALEAQRVAHVLLVDPVALRRTQVAASLRAAGRRVSEASTPLDAIDRLGESRGHLRWVAIADTVPPGIADDLRAYVRAAHADLELVRTVIIRA